MMVTTFLPSRYCRYLACGQPKNWNLLPKFIDGIGLVQLKLALSRVSLD